MGAKHLNLSTVVDKNKIESDKTFLLLFKVDVKDSAGATVTTLRFARNSENVTFQGNLFVAANFELDIKVEQQSEPTVSLRAQDQTRTLSTYVDTYDGLVKSEVTLYVVHEESLNGAPEMEETFLVVDASVSDYVVSFNLGVESAVAQRFPNFRQFRNRCAWKYKGTRCKYAGALPTCDFTRDGPNGCIAHDNEINFGGFPGLNDLM
jgi:phage-related protein